MSNLPMVSNKAFLSVSDDPLQHFLSGQLSERTRRAYHADIQHFFSFIGIDKVSMVDIQAIGHEHIIAFRNELAAETTSEVVSIASWLA
ncbi:MAG: site-specific integrase [Candidatus Latescibacterota bacterium]